MTFRFANTSRGNYYLDKLKVEIAKLDPAFKVHDGWIFSMRPLHEEIDRCEKFLEARGKAGLTTAKAATVEAAVSILRQPAIPAPAARTPTLPAPAPPAPPRTSAPVSPDYQRIHSLRRQCNGSEAEAVAVLCRTLDRLAGAGASDKALAGREALSDWEKLKVLDAAVDDAEAAAQRKPAPTGEQFRPTAAGPTLAELRCLHANCFGGEETRRIEQTNPEPGAQFTRLARDFLGAELDLPAVSYKGMTTPPNPVWMNDRSRTFAQTAVNDFFACLQTGGSGKNRNSPGSKLAAKFLEEQK